MNAFKTALKIFIFTLLAGIFITNNAFAADFYKGEPMNLTEIRNQNSVIDIFIKLAEIPSPSLKEDAVANKIIEILKNANISAEKDSYGNVIAKIPATKGYEKVAPMLLSAHMDVVGGDEPVNIRLSDDGKYIETDKTRTLGSDDKAGIAAILDVALKLAQNPQIHHGLIEMTFTKDEESGMTGVKMLDTSKIQSEHVLIADGDYIGECNNQGASFTNVYLSVTNGKGGHSGVNIQDETRVNAIKVLSQIDSEIPQGVYKTNAEGVITSINAGVIIGGSAGMYVDKLINDNAQNLSPKEILAMTSKNSFLNIIATDAYSSYSVRSSEPENEQQLLNQIKNIVEKYQQKYGQTININVDIQSHLKPFVKDKDQSFVELVVKSAHDIGINSKACSFHAGAESHAFQNDKKNAANKPFKAVIIGAATIDDMHSPNEKFEWKTLLKGRDWIERVVINAAK